MEEEEKVLNVAALQMQSVIGDRFANYEKVEKILARDLDKGTDLLVLPEVWTVGWSCEDFPAAAENIENSDTINFLSEIAKKYGVIAYPTMLILRPDGSVKYRMQGGTEASHFADKGRYALSPEIAYDTLKAYGSLSTCPLARRADYIIALSDAGDIHSPQESIAAYLKEVEGDKALYPEVWKLCGHFSDTYENPVFQFILKHWRDFSFVDRTELESKAERLIFPRYLEFLAGGMPQAEFDEMRRLVRSVDFRKDYSIVYLNRLTTLWLEKNWKSLMEFYNEEVFELPDAKVRLNLDVLLRYFAKEAPDDVKEQMRAYVEKCLQNPDPKAENGYKNLLKSI